MGKLRNVLGLASDVTSESTFGYLTEIREHDTLFQGNGYVVAPLPSTGRYSIFEGAHNCLYIPLSDDAFQESIQRGEDVCNTICMDTPALFLGDSSRYSADQSILYPSVSDEMGCYIKDDTLIILRE